MNAVSTLTARTCCSVGLPAAPREMRLQRGGTSCMNCPAGARNGHGAHPVVRGGKVGPGSRPVPEPAGEFGQVFGVFAQQTITAALFLDDAGGEFMDEIV